MRSLAVMQVLVPLLIMTQPATLWAGPAQTRRGFWLSFGFGPGSARVRCAECAPRGRETSFSGWLRLGGTIGKRLLLGWEGSGWLGSGSGGLQTDQEVDRTLGSSSVVALYYPRAASGLFVKGGVGLSYAGLPPPPKVVCTTLCPLEEGAHAVGAGVTAGVGYDVRVGRNVSITPELSFATGSPGDLRDAGAAVATRWKQDLLALGIGVTFH